MIGKVLQNNNFRETTRYVLDKEEAKLLGGTVMGHETDTISREFLMSKDLNPEIKRPVYHLIDSYSYEDAATKDLSDEFQRDRAIEHFAGLVVSAREPELLRQDNKTEYKQKVNDFIESELYEYQWFCAAHEDTKHRHTHLVASRINLVDGRCIPTWQDKERSHRICREIERENGLQQLQSYYEIGRRSPTRGQLEEWEKTGIPPVMVVMQDAIDQEATPGRSLDQLREALRQNHGIDSRLVERNSKPGVVFQKAGKAEAVRMSGSQLGRGYTLSAIERRLERNTEVEPPEAKPTNEVERLDTIDQLMSEQQKYAERIAPHINRIWEYQSVGRPRLKTATFEDYQIRLNNENQPDLYRRGRKLLENSADGKPRSYGLTEADCTAMQRFNTLSRQEAQDRLKRARQLQTQQKERSSKDRDWER